MIDTAREVARHLSCSDHRPGRSDTSQVGGKPVERPRQLTREQTAIFLRRIIVHFRKACARNQHPSRSYKNSFQNAPAYYSLNANLLHKVIDDAERQAAENNKPIGEDTPLDDVCTPQELGYFDSQGIFTVGHLRKANVKKMRHHWWGIPFVQQLKKDVLARVAKMKMIHDLQIHGDE